MAKVEDTFILPFSSQSIRGALWVKDWPAHAQLAIYDSLGIRRGHQTYLMCQKSVRHRFYRLQVTMHNAFKTGFPKRKICFPFWAAKLFPSLDRSSHATPKASLDAVLCLCHLQFLLSKVRGRQVCRDTNVCCVHKHVNKSMATSNALRGSFIYLDKRLFHDCKL